MADPGKLDIKKVIEDNARVTDVASLATSGVRRVKVLDENTLQELIRQAIEQVVSSSNQEERSRILADSRKQLQKLMNERDEFMSRADSANVGRNELIQQIEKLQGELKLRRAVEEEGAEAQKKVETLTEENSWLRQEHDRMVEELDTAQTEIKRLNDEIARLQEELEALRATTKADQEQFVQVLEAARAEAAELRSQIAQQGDEAGSLKERVADADTLANELEASQAELSELKDRLAREEARAQEADALRKELEEIRQAGELASAAVKHELDRVREETHKEATRRADIEQRFKDAQAEIERLHQEAAPPPEPPVEVLEEVPVAEAKKKQGREPIVILPSRKKGTGVGKQGKGLDIGTVNLVASEQNQDGDVELRLQRNVFIDVEITPYTKAMLSRLTVPYVIQGKRMYVLGESAFQLANVLNRRTRRPMKDGLISPKEQDALPVMKLMIGSILGEPRAPGEVCFYSVPGDPVDSDMSVAYHRDLFDAVLKSLGYKPSHILEGHAVTFAELTEEDFTGIGVSCGGGMFNVCVAYKSMPALTFSTARSGDWVDMNVAQVLGIKPEKAAQIKEKGVDLMKPMNREEDAVAIYYRNLIQYNITNIAERFRSADNMPTFNDPITIVFSGGTSMAGNFIELVKDVFKKIEFPIPVKDIRLAKDPLNATAKGALVAAQLEMANQAVS
jgi:predicted  nucleic acid-binding Zn-ribbon protein